MMTQKKISKTALIAMATISYAVYLFMQSNSGMNSQYKNKIQSAQIMLNAIQSIQKEHKRRGLNINKATDPNATGLIGPKVSIIVTDRGILDAK